MNARSLIFVSACFGALFLMTSTATAGSMHSHGHQAGITHGAPLHPQAPQAVSPFEIMPGDKRLHCELLGHNPLLPCPHHKVPAGERDRFLDSDCSGGPFQAPSSRSFGDSPRYLVPVVLTAVDRQETLSSISLAVIYDSFHSDSLDRPPRAL